MLVGYNHNIRYKGEVFHVQTEDSGINSPHIITLLYRGGNIIASKKTSYADIVKMGNLNQIVEELMKDQHKDMLRRLKSAEFDARLGLEGVFETPHAHAPEPPAPVQAVPLPVPKIAAAPVPKAAAAPEPKAAAAPEPKVEAAPVTPKLETPVRKQNLDDLIFDFLSTGDERH